MSKQIKKEKRKRRKMKSEERIREEAKRLEERRRNLFVKSLNKEYEFVEMRRVGSMLGTLMWVLSDEEKPIKNFINRLEKFSRVIKNEGGKSDG